MHFSLQAKLMVAQGKSSFTVAREPGYSAGVYRITMTTAHPRGANYVIHTDAYFWGAIRDWEGLHEHIDSISHYMLCHKYS
jgi:hypothetical protein